MLRARPCLPDVAIVGVSRSEPLRAIRREDGLWESIETDDNHVFAIQPNVHSATSVQSLQRCRMSTKSVGVQTSPQPLPLAAPIDSTRASQLTGVPAAGTTPEAVTIDELQVTCTTSQAIVTTTLSKEPTLIDGDSPITPAVTQRRRGRPRKTPTGFRNPRRSVRFSDPLSPEDNELLKLASPRDSHVFVRLLNVVIQQPESLAIETGTATTQEYSWNNRGKGWREADRRSDEGLVQIVSLFDSFLDIGVGVFPVVLPTDRGGAGQSVKMVWDRGRACFLGTNLDGKILSVALGEMKDMARDPWARQFVGYIMR